MQIDWGRDQRNKYPAGLDESFHFYVGSILLFIRQTSNWVETICNLHDPMDVERHMSEY
jgi:hypothetical protein